MAAAVRELTVFAWIAERDGWGFRPAGLLRLTQAPGGAAPLAASEFAYGLRYLERPMAIEVDPVSLSIADRSAVRGRPLYPPSGLAEFGGIRDAAPDAWGRRVIEARRKVPANSLTEAEYLLEAGGDRVGALDVRASRDSPESPSASDLQSLDYLLLAADAVEAGNPVPAQLDELLGAGASAGGARPKASLRDETGLLWLAKFPSRSDTWDMAMAERCTLELARRCGMTVPASRYLEVGNRPILLVRRFDRFWARADSPLPEDLRLASTVPAADTQEGRLPFASGLTLVACNEFDSRTRSYADLARAMRKYVHPERIRADLEELFTRLVFNILMSNDDDHLRNHGFIFDPRLRGWTLSPLYDVVPRPSVAYERFLHLDVGVHGKLATLDNVLSHYQAFLGKRTHAIEVMNRVWRQVREWKTGFEELGAPGQLIDRLSPAVRELDDIASPALRAEIRKAG